MRRIVEFMLEACFLKHLPRSGYQYLGTGSESVAEHVYTTAMLGFVFAHLTPEADTQRLMTMCLLHDLPEARIGDLNYVQKQYVRADEKKALSDTVKDLPFGPNIVEIIDEFNACRTLEAKLAHDADQVALIIDLIHLKEIGHKTPDSWLPHIEKRLKTEIGRQLAETVMQSSWDGWWRKMFE